MIFYETEILDSTLWEISLCSNRFINVDGKCNLLPCGSRRADQVTHVCVDKERE